MELFSKVGNILLLNFISYIIEFVVLMINQTGKLTVR